MEIIGADGTGQWICHTPKGDLIEMGVYIGNNMRKLVESAASVGNPFDQIWGFDSFVGLPEEAEGIYKIDEFTPGHFNLLEDKGFSNLEDAYACIKKNVGRDDINFVPGFYSETLTEELGRQLTGRANYIHIDCDLYISTAQALDWLYKYKIPICGALVRYDDWALTTEWESGESLAHLQTQRKYNVTFDRLEKNIFRIISYENSY